jgi:protein-S-isoprenylcysteine O-methyltransferase Ste14
MNESNKRVMPPVYFFTVLIIMIGLHIFLPASRILSSPYKYFGSLLIICGFVLNIWCSNTFSKAGTPIKPFEQPNHLVTKGPFRISRNPMYLGMVFVLFGVSLLLGTVSPLIAIPVFILVIQKMFIKHEEKSLEQTFDEEYHEYRKRVRRWI